MSIDARLTELGITLPSPAPPVANYLPYKQVGDMLYLSGMVPLIDGKPCCTGHLGGNLSLEEGVECARVCTLNALGWLKFALSGDLGRMKEVVRVRGFVACTPEFTDQPAVINGCSDLLVEVFGDKGKHTRAAVGSVALPLGVPVEIDFIFCVS